MKKKHDPTNKDKSMKIRSKLSYIRVNLSKSELIYIYLNRFKEWLQVNENKGGKRNIVNQRGGECYRANMEVSEIIPNKYYKNNFILI